MKWLNGQFLSFDVESTSPDPETARIVTASAMEVGPSGAVSRGSWLVNPGVDIPAEATAIHGVTTEAAQTNGDDPAFAIPQMALLLSGWWDAGLPVIATNAQYDLTVMQRELARLGLPPLTIGYVLDPFVIDRGCDTYRKGKRTLTAMATHYGVRQDEAHTARGDALTAARLVWTMVRRYPLIAAMTLDELQAWQRDSHAARQANYADYLRKQGKPEVVDRRWPCR